MKSRRTRRTRKTTRKRGGATIPDYTTILEEKKQMFLELSELLENELRDKQYITKSLHDQLVDAIRHYPTNLGQPRVPIEIRRADTEYTELSERFSSIFDRLITIPLRGGKRRQV